MYASKQEGFHFDFSNSECSIRDKQDKLQHYKVCDVCGCWCKSNSGEYHNWYMDGSMSVGGLGMCNSCASQLRPLFSRFYNDIERRREEIFYSPQAAKRRNSERNKEISKKWEDAKKRLFEW